MLRPHASVNSAEFKLCRVSNAINVNGIKRHTAPVMSQGCDRLPKMTVARH